MISELKELGQALEGELENGYEMKRISNWAHKIYLDEREKSPELRDALLTIMTMEQGKEFEYSEEELKNMAKSLQR